MIHRTQTRDRQHGFTLIELLVVLAILGILVGLVAVAIFGLIGGQSQKNTETMLRKLHEGTQQQWSEASKQFKINTPPLSVQNMAAPDATGKRAQTIWLKLQLRREFPQSYAEILQPWGGVTALQADLPPIPSYVRALNGRTAANDPKTESAACLLIALQNHPHKGMKFNAEDALGASAIKDTDGDGVPEIVDGWGQPITFFRWGTGNAELNATNTSARGNFDRDTEDPDHTLMDGSWNNASSNPNVGIFEQLCHRIEMNGTRQSFFTIPVIVSPGKDGNLGLAVDMSPLGKDAEDNIYSFKVR